MGEKEWELAEGQTKGMNSTDAKEMGSAARFCLSPTSLQAGKGDRLLGELLGGESGPGWHLWDIAEMGMPVGMALHALCLPRSGLQQIFSFSPGSALGRRDGGMAGPRWRGGRSP